VSLVAVAVAGLYSSGSQKTATPPLDLKASAFPSGISNGAITLTHAGGSAFNRSDLDVQVSAGGTLYGRATVAGSGQWDIGQAVTVPLTKPLTGGEHLDISIISKSIGAVVASSTVDVPHAASAPLPPGSFIVTPLAPAAPADVAPQSVLRIAAHVAHVDGRKAIASVWVDLSALGGAPYVPLEDNGIGADLLAGDQDYASYVTIPPEATPGAALVPLAVGAQDVDGNLATPGVGSLAVRVVSFLNGGSTLNFTNNGGNATVNNPGNVTITPGIAGAPGANGLPGGTGGSGGAGGAGGSGSGSGNGTVNNFVFGNVSNLTVQYQNTTSLNVSGANGPPELREPGPFSPSTAAGNQLVRVFGQNFSFVNSVRLVGSGGAALGSVWWIVGDSEIDLIAPIVSTPSDWQVQVGNPVGTDTSVESLHLLLPPNAPTSPPEITGMTPTHGPAGTEVKLTGHNLSFVTTVRLAAGGNVFSTAFFVVAPDGTETHFFVPIEAPPTSYVVTASGPGGSASPASQFIVDPRPAGNPLTITDFNPKSGPPFTQINVTGTGFLSVVAANVGGANVAMWVVNDTTMSILTHPAVPVQRFNHVTLFNTTGSVDVCCFNESALAQNEYAVYPIDEFARLAFNMTKFASNDSVGVVVKFNMTKWNFTTNGETFQFSSLTLETPNFKPGGAVTDTVVGAGTVSGTNRVMCSPAAALKNGVWAFYITQGPKKYSANSDTLPFLFWFEWTSTTNAAHTFDVSVGSSLSQTQDFTLGPQATSKIVKDGPNYDWPSSFTDCSNTP
jgi:hypothetical protein